VAKGSVFCCVDFIAKDLAYQLCKMAVEKTEKILELFP